MATDDSFRARLDGMIDLRHPLAVLAQRMPWSEIEQALAPSFAHRDRQGRSVEGADLFGPTLSTAGAGMSHAGRPRLPIRLMVALLYLKHAYGLSDEEVVERWAENVQWQFFSGMAYYEPRLLRIPLAAAGHRPAGPAGRSLGLDRMGQPCGSQHHGHHRATNALPRCLASSHSVVRASPRHGRRGR